MVRFITDLIAIFEHIHRSFTEVFEGAESKSEVHFSSEKVARFMFKANLLLEMHNVRRYE